MSYDYSENILVQESVGNEIMIEELEVHNDKRFDKFKIRSTKYIKQ